MRILLDTSIFLKLTSCPEDIPRKLRQSVDEADERFLSTASVWEMAVKKSLGKLDLPEPVATFVPDRMKHLLLRALPVTLEHAAVVENLPWHHRDPFDRLLIAQGMIENLTILTTDRIFSRYRISMLRQRRGRR